MTIPAQAQDVCLDQEGRTLAQDCNAYIESLYEACPEPDQILEAPGAECVALEEFRRPLIGCTGEICEQVHPYAGYLPYFYEAPTDAFRIEGDLGSDTVVIFLQGGPSDQFEDRYAQYFEPNFLVAYVAQTNFVKPGLIDSYNMTVQEARREMDENIALIWETYRAIRDIFPEKRVTLAGHSMGGFLAQDMLAQHGNPFDAVVIMGARLDAPVDFVRRFSIGQNVIFDTIGDPELYVQRNGLISLQPLEGYLVRDYVPNSETILLAAIGAPRYTERLSDVDMTNVLYVYSDQDEQVGGLSEAEIAFLEGKGALVVNVGWDEGTLGHSRMLMLEDFLEPIADFMRED